MSSELSPSYPSVFLIAVLLAVALVGPAAAQAQSTLTGAILNGLNGQPIRGATVQIENAEATSQSDVDGIFRISLAAGSYSLIVRKPGFETVKVTNVELADGASETVSVVLMPAQDAPPSPKPDLEASEGSSFSGGESDDSTAILSETITVTESAASSSESALLTERKRAAQISDGIGKEEIGKITGSDAAGVLKRVTGVSLQDDKYAYVRGLGDRYSQTTLNGSKLPSTEFERKGVPLDLFPADLLEKITVSKSYTVDKPGDFAAGLVELVTREFPPRQVLSIGLGLGSNSETTGDPTYEYAGGLSFSGSGGQPLPSTTMALGALEPDPGHRLHPRGARSLRRGADRRLVHRHQQRRAL